MDDFECGDFADDVVVCRSEHCDLEHLHPEHRVKRKRGGGRISRSVRVLAQTEPWKLPSVEGLREATLRAISSFEPRSFATVLSHVENDYGSCCGRSVHRHLLTLRAQGKIVRLDFNGRLHAYLRTGSRLVTDPSLVLEVLMVQSGGFQP